MSTTIVHGDWIQVLPTLRPCSFRTCITSPPYLWQRHYLPDEHEDAQLEVGREESIEGYVDVLVKGFRLVRRTLTDDGTLWLNLGDTYSAGGVGGGGSFMKLREKKGWRGKNIRYGWRPPPSGLSVKQLLGMPWRVAFALQADGWVLRSEIIWHKPNALPASMKDRPTCAHEHVFLFAKNTEYFFDQNAIREPYATPERAGRPISGKAFKGQRAMRKGGESTAHDYANEGRNARTIWSIATERSGTEHSAPMPLALARRCLLAGSAPGDHVLDPFGGSGTVGLVAEQEWRHATLIDLDGRAIEMARTRVKPGLLRTA